MCRPQDNIPTYKTGFALQRGTVYNIPGLYYPRTAKSACDGIIRCCGCRDCTRSWFDCCVLSKGIWEFSCQNVCGQLLPPLLRLSSNGLVYVCYCLSVYFQSSVLRPEGFRIFILLHSCLVFPTVSCSLVLLHSSAVFKFLQGKSGNLLYYTKHYLHLQSTFQLMGRRTAREQSKESLTMKDTRKVSQSWCLN